MIASPLLNVLDPLDAKVYAYLADASTARERHALSGQVPPYRQRLVTSASATGWAAPPAAILQTFVGDVEPVQLRPAQPYYRVVGRGSRPNGCFWTEERPDNEDDMRRDLALLNEWNGDHGLVTLVPHSPISAWRGRAAPQRASGSLPGHLPGGAIQLWLPRALDLFDGRWTVEQL